MKATIQAVETRESRPIVEALTLVVRSREVAAEGVVALTLTAVDGETLPRWEPGAHVDLLLAPGLVRQYSLCGDPDDVTTWRIAVLLEREGRGGSRFVHENLHPGSVVSVAGPRNHFALARTQTYQFIAGGIGITPILPMIRRVEARRARWRLAYGGRTLDSMAFKSELAEFGAHVDLCPEDRCGVLDLDGLLGATDAATLVYCCGPEGLIRAVEARCRDWSGGRLRVERFVARPPSERLLDRPFRVVFARSGITAEVGNGQSIVDVAERCGVPLSSSCREGVCGTCEVAVLDGRPDHRDSVLDAEERASGGTIIACVSRAETDVLTLDV